MNKTILTLTLNPAIDSACETDRVEPTRKLRTSNARYDPGGGGINVARVLQRLGSRVHACYLAGGVTGALLDQLIDGCNLPRTSLPIAQDTRIAHAVHERETGAEYRFVPQGPLVSATEWQGALDSLASHEFDILVASGSLPAGVPDDFYARLLAVLSAHKARLILDSSGAPLAKAVEAGGLWAIKPNQAEFEALMGKSFADIEAMGAAATALAAQGAAEHIIISMGGNGALYANAQGHRHCLPPPVTVSSAVGAGDSFVAGLAHTLAEGWSAERAFLYGMAAGTAAALTPGTELCHKDDVERLFMQLSAAE